MCRDSSPASKVCTVSLRNYAVDQHAAENDIEVRIDIIMCYRCLAPPAPMNKVVLLPTMFY